MQHDFAGNEMVESVIAGTHFIPRLGMQMHFTEDGGHILQLDIGDRPVDVGLVGLLADMAGGQVIIMARQPCESATTQLEVHDASNLVGPGEIVARSRLLATSKRRGVIEHHFELGGGHAVAHTTFAVRDGSLRPTVFTPAHRQAPSMQPLWQFIGARQEDGRAAITLGPLVANHVEALHGGAVIALGEAAALQALQPGELLESVSIHYLHAVRGATAYAAAQRFGRSVVVDITADDSPRELARLVFTVA